MRWAFVLALGLAACPLQIEIACSRSQDCGPAEVCVSGICTPGSVPFGAPCGSDADCGSGGCAMPFPCGYCVASCDAQGNCAAGGACVSGTCFRACSSVADCRNGYTCSAASAAPSAPFVCVPEADAIDAGC